MGQLVAETLHLYGSNFFLALPLGLLVAAADQASLGLEIGGRIVVLLAAAPLLSAGYAAAASIALERRPGARTWASAIVVGTVVFLPAAFLFPWFALAAIIVLALLGNAVPATIEGDLSPIAAVRRSLVVARADLVHALGGLATLAIMFAIARLAMGFLLREQADNTLRVAIFLADTVLGPDPVPRRGPALHRPGRAGRDDTIGSPGRARGRSRPGEVVSAARSDSRRTTWRCT